MAKHLEDIYKEVAEELGLSKYVVEDAYKSQLDLVVKTMGSKTDKPIRLPFIGVFRVKKKRREYLNKNKDGQQD